MTALERILKTIKYDKPLNGELECLEVDELDNAWCFYINLFEVISPNDYFIFSEMLKNHVKENVKHVNHCKLITKFKVASIAKEDVEVYYNYALETLRNQVFALNSFSSFATSYLPNEVIIKVPKGDASYLRNNLGYLANFFNKIGLEIKLTVEEIDGLSGIEKLNEEKKKEEDKIIERLEKEEDKKKLLATGEIKGDLFSIKNLPMSEDEAQIFGTKLVVLEGYLFEPEFREHKRGTASLRALLTDFTDTISISKFIGYQEDRADLFKEIMSKPGLVRISGSVKYSPFERDVVVDVKEIREVSEEKEQHKYSEVERLELHMHSKMTSMDAISDVASYAKEAKKRGLEALCITDLNTVQSFPDLESACKKNELKPIYGLELSFINDQDVWITKNASLVDELNDLTYVVFDIETTSLSVELGSIIEIAAVKVKHGVSEAEFSEFIHYNGRLSEFTKRLTNISDADLANAKSEEEVLTSFKEFIKGTVLVAHNASFDTDFIKEKFIKYGLYEGDYPIIDTLNLARVLYFDNPKIKLFNLKALSKFLEVEQTNHHRAIYDTRATVGIFNKLMLEVERRGFKSYQELNTMILPEKRHLYTKPNHLTLLVKNLVGKKNLYKLISLANTTKFYRTTRCLLSDVSALREGLLVGAGCVNSEIFEYALNKSYNDLLERIKYYDYVELMAPSVLAHLTESSEGEISREVIVKVLEKIKRAASEAKVLVIASGDVHHLREDEKDFRKIYLRTPTVGGGRHPLASIENIPSMHFRTLEEMNREFSFLSEEERKTIILDNPRKLVAEIEDFPLFPSELFKITDDFLKDFGIPSSDAAMKEMVYKNAHDTYGNPLPKIVAERIDKELTAILKQGFGNLYFISHMLVKNSVKAGYLVGSRGSVGSSVVATMMKITEVNSLPPHYVCPKCKNSIFKGQVEGEYNAAFAPLKRLVNEVESGFDLPSAICPVCGTKLKGDGHDTPFEVFLGFKGDKVPDIDLNFSGEYQSQAHEDLRTWFGVDRAFRAGTISTVQDNKAFGFVKGYYEDIGQRVRTAEVKRIAKELVDVRQSTGQHPGGVVVVPKYIDIYDVTPIQYPADNTESNWRTTHFDYHKFESNLFKVDVLGHDDPTLIAYLMQYVKANPEDFPFDNVYDIPVVDEKVMTIFRSTEALGVSPSDIDSNVGTYAVPEMGTAFVRQMLEDTKPSTFSGLVKISGLSHGTDVWLNNAKDLVGGATPYGKIPFSDVIGCRDDIMVYLMYQGVEPSLAFKIMETVRKGKKLSEEQIAAMKEKNVPEWYIWSQTMIKYLFPKAHAIAYVMMALRIAWFKVHTPIYFYAVYFSKRASYFDSVAFSGGRPAIRRRIDDIKKRQQENTASATELKLLDILYVALEMTCRGLSFNRINLEKSLATDFVISSDKKSLYLPFASLDGLGENVANKIVEARQVKAFTSIKDFKDRTGTSTTTINKLMEMGVFDGLPEDDKKPSFSLFDLGDDLFA